MPQPSTADKFFDAVDDAYAAFMDTLKAGSDRGYRVSRELIEQTQKGQQEALKLAGVQAAEAIYVGDQYRIDIGGANEAGMKGVLLDRGGYMEEAADCPRIQSLSQIVEHL